jgi:hypothetical protein
VQNIHYQMKNKEVLEFNAQISEYLFFLKTADELIIGSVENIYGIQGMNFYVYFSS